MEKYKIRVTSGRGDKLEEVLFMAADFAAVRRGRQLATPGEKLEVYRGEECIFVSEQLGMRLPLRAARPTEH